jgi:hypothetical protein
VNGKEFSFQFIDTSDTILYSFTLTNPHTIITETATALTTAHKVWLILTLVLGMLFFGGSIGCLRGTQIAAKRLKEYYEDEAKKDRLLCQLKSINRKNHH